MISITRGYEFTASHRLHLAGLTDEQNEQLYGKCNNPFGHGHNYRLEVSVTGPTHEVTGQMVPLANLDRLVREHVLNLLDHRYLNVDVPAFSETVPTTENVLLVIWDQLEQHWDKHISGTAQLCRVRIQETERNAFELSSPCRPRPAAEVYR